ncbi:MAG: 6-phosphogluconolactonase [Firmicutes bacterium]|jgi:6-phosphogluconolactonase|uniref:6-phosphogluconolactonase n=1 Tax=Sulfobacillus benefaciens TaxID=453960 RepID=A0A2T2X2H7_9FIRM|nr:6-phosphogluconolactonase [Bacillota bacterium]MCL5015210.1 6-phosphogluconolactonase [Bacillota bacterium]PSR28695.1 MAG: 6-phosphogluconolactonase [Sulfobacillus benefaciens]HBQ95756.1 6-phosphogluconolactonase [Sulfobacillus sp.]
MPDNEIHISSSVDAVVADLAGWIVDIAGQASVDRGKFRIALSGGSTPKALYSLLAKEPFQDQIDWSRTEIFFGDERDVPPTHPDSNYHMANETLFSRLRRPPLAVHRWYTEYSPELALADYRSHLTENGTQSYPPSLDLILLGLGPEGHTASLFPDQPVLNSPDLVAHVFVPSHQSWRYTFTLPLINQARHIAFLVTGETKRDIVSHIFLHHLDVPAARVRPVAGDTHWFLDEQSAANISTRK